MVPGRWGWGRFGPGKFELLRATLVCTALVVVLCRVMTDAVWSAPEKMVPGASVEDIGWRLLTVYLVPFEVAGVLLMIVMVGAAHLARQEK